MLELKHIKKVYNPGTVTEMCLFDDFNLTVKDGEFVSICLLYTSDAADD